MNTFNNIITEYEINKYLKEKNPTLSDTALKWETFHFIKKNGLEKIGLKTYKANAHIYSYNYFSPLSSILDEFISEKFPNIKYLIWENIQLNEWLNLLIMNNIIYLEVEKDCIDFVFSEINNKYGNEHLILLNPSDADIARYMREDLIVVKTLYSKSPLSKIDHKIKLEKLIVDIIAKDITFDTRGIEDIVNGIKDTYDIDIDKALAYANRRKIKDKLLEMWEEKKL